MSSDNAAEKLPEPKADTPTESEPGVAANDAPAAANDAPRRSSGAFEVLLGDVPLQVTVELGRVSLTLREVGERLGPGSVIPLSKLTGESLDVRVNDRLVARAEAVAIGDRYGARIVEIIQGESK